MTAYQIALAIDLHGALDRVALSSALQTAVRRHEVLRSVFIAEAGVPRQCAVDDVSIPFEFDSLTALPEAARAARFHSLALELERMPMDLASGPLLRARLCEMAPDHHRLALIVHHIVFDGWSVRLLLDEVAAAYAAIRAGGPDSRPPLAFQYADYAAWQRAVSTTPLFTTQLDYWRRKLAAPLPVLEMPLDFERPRIQSWDGAVVRETLDAGLRAGIEQLARSFKVTPFVVLLAGWKALLYRYTSQEDCIVGCALAGRNRVEWESLIGFFINTVALRTRLGRDLNFAALVAQVHEVAAEAQEYQDVPFERVVAAVHRERDLSRPPLIQAMFVLHNTPAYAAACPGLALTAEEISASSAKFDLALAVQPDGDAFALKLEYATALFKKETAATLLRRYAALLQDAVSDPTRAIADLELGIGATAGDQALDRASAVPSPDSELETTTLQDVFERRVAQSPAAPAVTCDGTTLTYGELNARANRLAHHLRRLGVGPDVLVGLCLDRSIDTVLAILAVLKSGGAYVPIDPGYPAERIGMIVSDAQCAVAIVHARHADRLKGAAKTVVLDGIERPWERESDANPPRHAIADNLAYVIYTSGSTGKPKGVLITHGNVVCMMRAMNRWYSFGPADVWTLFHSYAFDFSVWEMWGALFHGGRLVVVPLLVSRSPEAFYRLLLDEGVTILNQTPSAFRQLQHYDETVSDHTARGLKLREVLLGGETVDLPGLAPWFTRHGDTTPRLANAYGVTETTVFVTCRPLSVADTAPGTPSLIGSPPPGWSIEVVDAVGRPVAVGETGELIVGGLGIARGYLRRPELTAERFIPDGSGAPGNGQKYKTGDIVRLLDGDLEFIGRNDFQVQIRGFRVELGEIEAALSACNGIQGAVVRLREFAPGDQRLVAYYLARTPLASAELRDRLLDSLPAHMVPAAFVHLEAFPLNTSGKVDVQALPAPVAAEVGDTYTRPESATERSLAAHWAEMLHVERVGLDDNFFALGGHSLLAIQLVTRINEAMGAKLALGDLFEYPTVRCLAARLGDLGGRAPVSRRRNALLQIKPGTGIPFFCVKGAGDVGGSYETFAGALAPDQPFYGFPDLHNEEGAPGTVEFLASRCIQEMKKVRPKGPYYIGGYSFGGVVAFEIARQLLAAGEEVPLIAMLDSAVPRRDHVRRGFTFEYTRYVMSRMRVHVIHYATAWKMLVGYLRDGVAVFAQRMIHPPAPGANLPGLREYLRWIGFDVTVQYFLIQAGLVKPSIGERRLRMVEEATVRESAKSMAASTNAMHDYKFTPIPARITLFRAEHDPSRAHRKDPTLGWGRLAEKGADVVVVPGNHMVIIRHPFAIGLGKALQKCIDGVQRGDKP